MEIVGYKGAINNSDAGYFHCPYIPLGIQVDDITWQQEYMTMRVFNLENAEIYERMQRKWPGPYTIDKTKPCPVFADPQEETAWRLRFT